MANPTCQVKDGAAAFVATTNGVDVTPGNTVTIALVSSAGVKTWGISVVGTDELLTAAALNAALSVDGVNKVATFTAPAAGSALIFLSTVTDNNGAVATTTLGIYTRANGYRVGAVGEMLEGNAAFGWVAKYNPIMRSGGGSYTPPTGSGFPHITGGAQDPAARAIDLTSSDTTGLLALNRQAGPTGTGLVKAVAGAYAAASALLVDADVSASAAIAVSKLAPSGTNGQVLTTTGGVPVWAGLAAGATSGQLQTGNGSGAFTAPANVLAGSGFISIGASPAASGALRLPNNVFVWAKDPSAVDRQIIGLDNSNYITLGGNVSTANMQLSLSSDDFILSTIGGQILRGGGGAGFPLIINDGGTGLATGVFELAQCLNADYSSSLATFQSCNLSISAQAAEVWEFEFVVIAQSAANGTGLQLGITAPAGSTIQGVAVANTVGTAPAPTQITALTTTGGTTNGINSLGLTSGAISYALYSGVITVGGTAGPIALQIKAGTVAQAVKILAGSKMRAKRCTKV